MKSKRNIFIIGLDDFNLAKLKRLPEASECEFIPAIKYSEMRGVDNISIPEFIKKCDERIKEKKRIDAIVTYFDFPGSVLVPIIAKKYNLPGPSLEGVLKCEHKYWSRLEQKKVIPDNIPEFEIFDPFDRNAFDKIDLAPPFWIKPVKSYHSFLAYRIEDHKQFKKHIKEILPQIGFMARPFKFILKEYFMPAEFAGMTEKMIAENEIRGHQCTAEGYVFDGEAEIYGIVDSVREEESSSFLRYEYPSSLPGEAQKAIVSLAKKAILQTGIMNSAFNIEFFYDKKNDHINLLEINPRISQAHTDIFEKVHGFSHHKIMLNIALHRKPINLEKKGDFKVAAHFMLRSFKSGIVIEVPDRKQISELKNHYPGLSVFVNVRKGQDLNSLALHHSDSYSYILANILLGAENREELIEKYNEIVNKLSFKITSC